MSTSNEASGDMPGVFATEISVTEKSAGPRARKSPAAAKKTAAAKKSAGKKNVTAPEADASSSADPGQATGATQPQDKSAASKRPRARKSAPKKSAEADPAAMASDDQNAAVSTATAAPPKTPARKAAPRKSAPKKSPAKKDLPPASETFAPEQPVATPRPQIAAQEAALSEASPVSEVPAPGFEAAPEKPSASRRRRGSRGRGRGAAARKEAAAREAAQSAEGHAVSNAAGGAALSGTTTEGYAPVDPSARDGQSPSAPLANDAGAKALPPAPVTPALEGQPLQLALETGEVQKKSRRRKRGKGANGEEAREEADESVLLQDEDGPSRPARAAARRKRKMFVNVLAGEQVEVVVSEEGQLREYYVEMLHQAKIKGNIYKGVIHNVDPNLQAAFVSYGAAKNGFLQIDEVHPEYYLAAHETGKGYKYPLIQKVLRTGQEILVQVVKEPSGSKGAFLTSYLSLPGRYLVLTPGRDQIGVSRKVGNDNERDRLREILDGLSPGEGLGVIVRTVSEGAGKTNLQRDLQMLKRVWKDVRKKGSTEQAPALIYQELGLAARAVRDYLTDDVTELWVNDKGMAAEISEVIALMFPKRKDILQVHDDSDQSLFERFSLSKQIAQVQSREVVLPSGGRLVFDQTEALMAIDINSGRSGGKNNFEDMAFKINLEAAQHIPLQLRLRDIGGQVVVDFIEMRDRSHWREVEKVFRSGMKEDRARHDVGKISAFGLLEVVRQRLGSSAISIASEPCPFCKGTGIRRNMEWQAMQAMQAIQQLIRQNNEPGKTITYAGGAELTLYLLNSKKEWLLDMEQENNVKLELRPGI